MNVLVRYVVSAIGRNVALVLTVLVTVTTLFLFVSQIDDIGTANYGIREAILFVALRIPRTIVESLPAATLLGGLLGLGHLATQSELIAMRAAGVSMLQLLAWAGLAGILLAGIMVGLGESIAPSLGAYARELRSEALLDEIEIADGESTWFKDEGLIVNVRRGFAGSGDEGLYLYELDSNQRIRSIARANAVEAEGTNSWTLSGYAETRFAADRISVSRTRRSAREFAFNAELLGLSEVREDLLNTPDLQRYIAFLQENDRDASRYLIAYWGRWARSVSVPFMALLAVPFVFGRLRSVGSAARLIVGLCIGLGIYVADQVLTNSGSVYGLDPMLVAWAPTCGLIVITCIAALRAR
ncbi:MAG: LPS export ABC transporter permease LptG [Gammaproteobacteria bacterium]|jgi:lipopolysaccharide export system permease protein